MSVTTLTTEQVLEAAEESDIVHLVCCRDSSPAVGLCGWICTEPVRDDEPGPECIVCVDIAVGYGHDECVRGGRCPT